MVFFAVFLLGPAGSPANAFSFIRDAEIENTIRAYSTPLFQAAGLEPSNIKIFLVKDNSLNAFVAGGQKIFINTGLLARSQNAGQIIGVIAHETGHIAGGHLGRIREAMKKSTAQTILAFVLGGAAASARGSLAAQLTQPCVVSLKPVESRIEATFERFYGRRTEPGASAGIDIGPLAGEEDFPEPLRAGAIDLGEAAAEQLALELDPFPRLKDAAFAGYSSGGEPAAAEGSFAALAKLKKKSSIK